MNERTFSPTPMKDSGPDKIEGFFKSISQYTLVLTFGLLPVFVIPVTFLPMDYGKVVLVVGAVVIALISFSLSVLRSGEFKTPFPLALGATWLVAGATVISAVFSGDMMDSFFGDLLEVHTAVFVVLMALVASCVVLMGQKKTAVLKMYILLTFSCVVLALFHVARLFLGADFLQLGIFSSSVSTPMSNWNDLALLFGLSILLSLVAIEQLPLTKWGKGIFSFGVILSLVMLTVINFFAVWLVLALVSIVVLLYSITKDRSSTSENKASLHSIVLSLVVFVTSLTFIVGGASIASTISKITDISYVEVRPSFSATIDIARSVYAENAFLGTGPNKFIDAWRLYKDPSINQTVFWATDFKGGSGFVTTLFVTTGIFGMLAWLLFFATFIFTGFRMLFRNTITDRFWYFLGSSSFIASLYLWTMSLVYVPSATILLLTAVFTGVVLVASTSLHQGRTIAISVSRNKGTALVLVGLVMVTIVLGSTSLYFLGKHYTATYTFGSAVAGIQAGADISAIEADMASAYEFTKNDKFARRIAVLQVEKLNALLALQEPTTEQQQVFQTAAQNGITAAQLATVSDPTDAENWALLGRVYTILAMANTEGAKERAEEAFANARKYAPYNPSYFLLEAQLQYRMGNVEGTRQLIQEAIKMKPNYTDALLLLTQLEIAEGNEVVALETTKAIVSLEPNNPARYYQLGFLQASLGNISDAIVAFERAITIDDRYANARYLLALAYQEQGRTEDALAQLEVVLQLNPNNQDVISLISAIQSGTYTASQAEDIAPQITEPDEVREEDDAVITTENPDTPLITPVNIVGEEEALETAPEETSEEVTE